MQKTARFVLGLALLLFPLAVYAQINSPTIGITGSIGVMTKWATANRPAHPATGTFGFNTTISQTEYWDGAAWVQSGSTLSQWSSGTRATCTTLIQGTFGYNTTTDIMEYCNGFTQQWASATDGTINVQAFGAQGHNTGDDITAINAAYAYARTVAPLNAAPIKITYPPGTYPVSDSTNATGLNDFAASAGPGIAVEGYGAYIVPTSSFADQHAIYDMIGSYQLKISGLTFYNPFCVGGHTPSFGIQFGRQRIQNAIGLATSAGAHHFEDVNVWGCFKTAGIYNAAGENDFFENVSVEMFTTTGTPGALSGPYGYIADGGNYWDFASLSTTSANTILSLGITNATWAATAGGRATFTTASPHGLIAGNFFTIAGSTADTFTNGYNGIFTVVSVTSNTLTAALVLNPGSYVSGGTLSTFPPHNLTQSFLGNTWISSEIRSIGTGSASPIWISNNSQNVAFRQVYLNLGTSGTSCVYVSAPVNFGSSIASNWVFEVGCEPSVNASTSLTTTAHEFSFGGTFASITQHDLRISEPINHSGISQFGIDNGTGTISALSTGAGLTCPDTSCNRTYNFNFAPVPLSGGSGSGATMWFVTVSGCPGACLIQGPTIYTGGTGYSVSDSLTIPGTYFGGGGTVTIGISTVGIQSVQFQNFDDNIIAFEPNVYQTAVTAVGPGTGGSPGNGLYTGPIAFVGGAGTGAKAAYVIVTGCPGSCVVSASMYQGGKTYLTSDTLTIDAINLGGSGTVSFPVSHLGMQVFDNPSKYTVQGNYYSGWTSILSLTGGTGNNTIANGSYGPFTLATGVATTAGTVLATVTGCPTCAAAATLQGAGNGYSIGETVNLFGANLGGGSGFVAFKVGALGGQFNVPTSSGGMTGTVCEGGNCTTYVSHATAIAAIGASQADAVTITNAITTVTAATTAVGIILPACTAGKQVTVNPGGGAGGTFHVYGLGSDTINGTAGATGVSFTNTINTAPTIYSCYATGTWVSK